ncbi:hypothetical protein AB0H71_00700 [Nocardia sp. NPDC050697]|uniref:hypothetical protein n=1 Tax=Nocardia sp. NPDC050697 TaxID=3155158 RepID=UPI0033F9D081
MAILLYVRKNSESESAVVYDFGDDYENFVRTLTIETSSQQPRPDDGFYDHQFYDAARRILGLKRERGQWPERGMIAS